MNVGPDKGLYSLVSLEDLPVTRYISCVNKSNQIMFNFTRLKTTICICLLNINDLVEIKIKYFILFLKLEECYFIVFSFLKILIDIKN